jgi:hypothetical protein
MHQLRPTLTLLVALAACEVEPSDTAQSPPPPLPAQLTAGTAVRGESLWVTVRGAAPFASIDLAGGPGLGDGLCPTPVGSLCLDLVGARLLASGTADAAGVFHGNLPLPAGLGLEQIALQAVLERGTNPSVSNPVVRPVRDQRPPAVQICSSLPFNDPYDLLSAEINGDALVVNLAHSGGCQVHSFAACWDGSFMESLPEQVQLRVVHDDPGDPCDAYPSRTVAFDLSPIREAASTSPILVQGVGSTLTYDF